MSVDALVDDRCECAAPLYDFVVGGGVVGEPGSLDCEQPNLILYPCCGRARAVPCETTKAAFCKGCARRYRKRVQWIAREGLFRVRGRQAFVVTLTAPSGRPHCKRKDHPGCKGQGPTCKPCECWQPGFDVAAWNAEHTARKNHFLTALRRGEASPRKDGHRRQIDLAYFGGVEPQDGKRREDGHGRFALHDHLICIAPVDVTFSTSSLRKVAIAQGYGHSIKVDVLPLDGAKLETYGRIASYVGKVSHYVGKACDERALVPWRAAGDDPQRGMRWRAWTASRNWGVTMHMARHIRTAHLVRAVAPALPAPQAAKPLALDSFTASYAADRSPPDTDPVRLSLFILGEGGGERHGHGQLADVGSLRRMQPSNRN